MIKIKYKIKKVRPGIYAVIVPDSYHRAMLFLRYQEFYESPNAKFRGKNFSIWEYLEWYSKERAGKFTYGGDWSGFNLPLETLINCIQELKFKKGERDLTNLTPYDLVMFEISYEIFNANNKNKIGYVIGAGDTEGGTFMHEVCHGLYCTNPLYKKIANQLVKKEIDRKHYSIFKDNLLKMGYTNKVVDDEIQAYLLFGYQIESFGKGVSMKFRERYNKKFNEKLGEIIYENKQKRSRVVHKKN